MAVPGAFRADSKTYLVNNAATNVIGDAGGSAVYRVVNKSSSVQYFTWGKDNTVTSAGAPTAGTPSANTIGMIGSSVEVFNLPANCWVIASTSTGFEFTPGEGI